MLPANIKVAMSNEKSLLTITGNKLVEKKFFD